MTVAQKIPVVLVEVCVPVIADQAEQVNREGVFPEQAITALRDAGLLGAVSSTEVGGLGLGHRGATALSGLHTLDFM